MYVKQIINKRRKSIYRLVIQITSLTIFFEQIVMRMKTKFRKESKCLIIIDIIKTCFIIFFDYEKQEA